MNCTEFQGVAPDSVETGHSQEYERHAESCTECSAVLADLKTISEEALHLREVSEPSPRVWNRIEIALRQEGLIREPLEQAPVIRQPRWRTAWLMPLVACGVLAVGLVTYQRLSTPTQAGEPVTHARVIAAKAKVVAPSVEDRQFMAIVASRPPAIRAKYEADLQHVNAYIRDAQESVDQDPNDEVAQQYLMDAYQQKATMYQLALDRSLP